MEFKKEIQKQLFLLKKYNVDRREAERRLGYAEHYQKEMIKILIGGIAGYLIGWLTHR